MLRLRWLEASYFYFETGPMAHGEGATYEALPLADLHALHRDERRFPQARELYRQVRVVSSRKQSQFNQSIVVVWPLLPPKWRCSKPLFIRSVSWSQLRCVKKRKSPSLLTNYRL